MAELTRGVTFYSRGSTYDLRQASFSSRQLQQYEEGSGNR